MVIDLTIILFYSLNLRNLAPKVNTHFLLREITKEISSYIVFICVVLVITVGDRDTTFFALKNSINSNFITKNPLNQVSLFSLLYKKCLEQVSRLLPLITKNTL